MTTAIKMRIKIMGTMTAATSTNNRQKTELCRTGSFGSENKTNNLNSNRSTVSIETLFHISCSAHKTLTCFRGHFAYFHLCLFTEWASESIFASIKNLQDDQLSTYTRLVSYYS